MTSQQGKLIKDDNGREVVCFTTPSGVHAIVDTSISPEALDRFAKELAQKIADRQTRQDDDLAGQEPSAAEGE